MSQQAAAAPRGGEVTLYTEKHPAFAYCFRPEVMPMLEQNLVGNKDGLTVKRIMIDLGAMLMSNPRLAMTEDGVSRVREEVVFSLVLEATRYHTTFGDGGMWLIPDDGNVRAPVLRAQQSEKFITRRANEDAKCEIMRPIFIHQPDHPVLIERDPASGDIVKFTLKADADITQTRNVANLLGAFGRAKMGDGTIKIRWFDKADLDRFKAHSPAKNSPAWANDPLEMYARSVRAAMGRELAPIRTRVPGMVSSSVVPLIEMEQAEEGHFTSIPTAASATADLEAMANEPVPFGGTGQAVAQAEQQGQVQADATTQNPVERARKIFAATSTLEGLEEAWKGTAVVGCLAESDAGQRKHIAGIRNEREKEIREGLVAAARAQQVPAAPAAAPTGGMPEEEVGKALEAIEAANGEKALQNCMGGLEAMWDGKWSGAQLERVNAAFKQKWTKVSGGKPLPK